MDSAQGLPPVFRTDVLPVCGFAAQVPVEVAPGFPPKFIWPFSYDFNSL